MTDWKPTTEPNTCAMRCLPHKPVRVLATDLPGEYPVIYLSEFGDLMLTTESGRYWVHYWEGEDNYDLVPYRPMTVEEEQ